MFSLIIETNKNIFKNKRKQSSSLDNFKLIEEFARNKLTKEDWNFLCRRKDFIDAVGEGDYNKVKEIAKSNLVIK